MNCEFCKQPIDKIYSSKRFCSKSCSRKFAISRKNYNKSKIISCVLCHNKFNSHINSNPEKTRCSLCKSYPPIYKCNWCGQTPCLRKDICKHYNLFPTLISKFGMDGKTIGTKQIYVEFEKIQTILSQEYINNKQSLIELSKKYHYTNIRNFSKIMKSLNIKTRNLSDAGKIAIFSGRLIPSVNSKFKFGYHISWNQKKFFYRSSYEQDYYKILDSQKIDYEVESLKIQYWDSIKLKFRISIPDIYIPSTNTIIEIKSDYTFSKQNMIDKFKQYIKNGYNTKLILDKNEVNLFGDSGEN